jgi:predicted nucleic acid-binding protein
MRVFIDTNLWVYRLDKRDPEKSRRINEWLREVASEHDIVLSTQVLIEFCSVLTRKMKPSLPHAEIRLAMNALSQFEVIGTDSALIMDAHEIAFGEQLSWFDALIVEAAIRSGCQRLFSEDLSHGRQFGTLIVHNPFISPG